MAVNNQTILGKAWLAGTNDYQQRIPDPTQSGVRATMNALFDPMNAQYYNQFQDYLVNRIAYTYVHGKIFNNPLAEFKKNKIEFGSSIQNVAFKWLKAHSYVDDDESLLKMARPDGTAWYISQNRRDRYDLTISRDELRTAAMDEYGLNNLVARMMELPANSDNYDEFQIMLNIFALYETDFGFHRHNISKPVTDEASGKEFLTAVMSDAGYMRFPSTLYNASKFKDIPTFVGNEDLILITTPEVNANLNVQTYAGLFNMDVAKAQARIVEVPNIPIPNAIAVLTTRDIFDCHDTVLQTGTFYNPQTLSNNYYLHHWGIYALNPYAPAVLYTVGTPEDTPVITEKVTGLDVSADKTTAALGETVAISANLKGTVSPDSPGVEVAPDAVTYAVTLTAPEGDTDSALNSRTYVDNYGRLHIQKSGLKSGSKIVVHAATTYTNPTDVQDVSSLAGTVSITVK